MYVCIGRGPCKATPKWDWSVIGGEDGRRAIASHVRQRTLSEFADVVNNKDPKGCQLYGKVLRFLLKYLSFQFWVVRCIQEVFWNVTDNVCLFKCLFKAGGCFHVCRCPTTVPTPLSLSSYHSARETFTRCSISLHVIWTWQLMKNRIHDLFLSG